MQAARDDLSKVVTAWIEYFSQEGETDVSKLNERDGRGMAPVHYAAKFNRLRILKKLYNSGAGTSLSLSPSLPPALSLPSFLSHSTSPALLYDIFPLLLQISH